MKKFLIFIKPLVILMLAFALTGAMCGDDDDNSCSDAVGNAVDVFKDSGMTQDDICDEFAGTEGFDLNECKNIPEEDFEDYMTEELMDWCEEEPWDQDIIDCLTGADSLEDIDECTAE
ncbi:MAG: hypothetical protein JW864_13940 [Spirochaetes bacterium]|nr:hypothetical protein [Spirochaetota bacterium]